jgi:16S rRNA (adenine1518-N6/adenine1519-N6)-dimethyltransferase
MKHTLSAKKSLGQNFLNNAAVPRLMADAAELEKDDVVLEIGPGTGVLTKELLARAKRVIAIEADARAIELLQERFAAELTAGTLELVAGDARTLDRAKLGLTPRGYKVVANIPYYLSGFLFRSFLEEEIQPSCLVFLVQKEVAERIARDKKESLLSLSIRAYGVPHYVKTIKKGNFTPQPKIDSAIIAIRDISKDRFQDISEKTFFTLLHEGFKSRRKQLLGNLSDMYEREAVIHAFSGLKLPLTVRGEDVPLATWFELAALLEMHRKTTKNTRS